MPYKVLLTHDAVDDLEELDTWISTNDSPEKAEYVLNKIAEVFKHLSECQSAEPTPRNCLCWASMISGKSFSTPIALFTGQIAVLFTSISLPMADVTCRHSSAAG